jgi:hypothetical protein
MGNQANAMLEAAVKGGKSPFSFLMLNILHGDSRRPTADTPPQAPQTTPYAIVNWPRTAVVADANEEIKDAQHCLMQWINGNADATKSFPTALWCPGGCGACTLSEEGAQKGLRQLAGVMGARGANFVQMAILRGDAANGWRVGLVSILAICDNREQPCSVLVLRFVQMQAEGFRQSIQEHLKAKFDCAKCKKSPANPSIIFPRCTRCQVVRYCSRECQRADWPTHKLNCNPAAEEQKAGEADE